MSVYLFSPPWFLLIRAAFPFPCSIYTPYIAVYQPPLCDYRGISCFFWAWLRWRRDPDPALGQIAPRGSRCWASIIPPDLLRSRCGSTGPSCGSPGPWGPPYTPSGSLPGPMARSGPLRPSPGALGAHPAASRRWAPIILSQTTGRLTGSPWRRQMPSPTTGAALDPVQREQRQRSKITHQPKPEVEHPRLPFAL